MTDKELVASLLERVLGGADITETESYALAGIADPDAIAALHNAAAEVTARFSPRKFDSCSIVNARSGHCSENCKWCAQSAHYETGCKEYAIVDRDECAAAIDACCRHGIGRLSLVASGRSTRGKALDAIAAALSEAGSRGLHTCASLGLLGRETRTSN